MTNEEIEKLTKLVVEQTAKINADTIRIENLQQELQRRIEQYEAMVQVARLELQSRKGLISWLFG